MKLVDAIYTFFVIASGCGAYLAAVLAVLGIFRPCRRWCGFGITLVTYVWMVAIWFGSALTVFTILGSLWVFIGLVIFGIGIVPISLIAMLIHGYYREAGLVVLSMLITGAASMLGFSMMASADKDKATRHTADVPIS